MTRKPNNSESRRGKRICVDLDGVITQYEGWRGREHFDPPTPGVVEFLQGLRDSGYLIMIFTARTGPDRPADHALLVDYLTKHSIPYDDIFMGGQKPPALAYIDDRAVHASWRDLQEFMLSREPPNAAEEYWDLTRILLDEVTTRNKGPFEAPKDKA